MRLPETCQKLHLHGDLSEHIQVRIGTRQQRTTGYVLDFNKSTSIDICRFPAIDTLGLLERRGVDTDRINIGVLVAVVLAAFHSSRVPLCM